MDARRARNTRQITLARDAIAEHVLRFCALHRPTCIAAYFPWRTEPIGEELLHALHDLGCPVLLPVVLDDRDLDWARYVPGAGAPSTPQQGKAAISRADLLLVPALAVDGAGNRLGRGGGSYDRALLRRRADSLTVATVFDDELVEQVAVQDWDVAVRAAVTPGGWHHFDRNTAVPPAG